MLNPWVAMVRQTVPVPVGQPRCGGTNLGSGRPKLSTSFGPTENTCVRW
jgi:hypothetical protein